WLEEYIWPVEGKFVSYEFVKNGTEIAVYEMLRNGITTFVDMYFYENAVADVLNTVGMRGVLASGILDFPVPGAKTPDEAIAKTEEFYKEHQNSEYITVAVGPHAPYTCSPETLKKAMDLAEKYNLLYHIHLSETKFEVEQIKEKYGNTPIKHLETLGLLKENVLAAHVAHPTDEEIELMAKRNVKVSHCPESNLKLASGIAPIPKMLEAGICVSIGTDGTASNDDLDIIGEISTAAKLHKGYNLNPTVVNSREALLMATREGAKAIKQYDKIGSLEIGKKADITLIDITQPHLNPLFDPYTQIVYSSKGLDVDTVIINGDIKVLNREVLVLNKDYILGKAILWKNRILENR
ncbi:MAG: S-adenosylhomocysteine deaminase, partial [Persephonella sp.]